jgi:hypothetical protein
MTIFFNKLAYFLLEEWDFGTTWRAMIASVKN